MCLSKCDFFTTDELNLFKTEDGQEYCCWFITEWNHNNCYNNNHDYYIYIVHIFLVN